MTMTVPGSCTQIFSLNRDLDFACVNCQTDVQDKAEGKWQYFIGRSCLQVHAHTFMKSPPTVIHYWTDLNQIENGSRGQFKTFPKKKEGKKREISSASEK